MIINFKHNGQEYNNPDNQTHIDIQNKFTDKVKSLLEPILEQMDNEIGSMTISYNDNGKLILLTTGGYSVDTNAKLNILLKDAVL